MLEELEQQKHRELPSFVHSGFGSTIGVVVSSVVVSVDGAVEEVVEEVDVEVVGGFVASS